MIYLLLIIIIILQIIFYKKIRNCIELEFIKQHNGILLEIQRQVEQIPKRGLEGEDIDIKPADKK